MGYKKAVTFSFDDGNESDLRLLELLNKYSLKCSFNLNSGLIGTKDEWDYNGFLCRKLNPFKASYYDGHEICVHGLFHRNPVELEEDELLREFEDDKKNLEEIAKYPMVGAAYAYGAYDDRVVEVIKSVGLKYCRTVESTWDFSLQTDMLRYKATCHFRDEDAFDKIEAFLKADSATPSICYIWGHSYECDGDKLWDRLEDEFKLLSGRDDILYGTNTEVFKYFGMI